MAFNISTLRCRSKDNRVAVGVAHYHAVGCDLWRESTFLQCFTRRLWAFYQECDLCLIPFGSLQFNLILRVARQPQHSRRIGISKPESSQNRTHVRSRNPSPASMLPAGASKFARFPNADRDPRRAMNPEGIVCTPTTDLLDRGVQTADFPPGIFLPPVDSTPCSYTLCAAIRYRCLKANVHESDCLRCLCVRVKLDELSIVHLDKDLRPLPPSPNSNAFSKPRSSKNF